MIDRDDIGEVILDMMAALAIEHPDPIVATEVLKARIRVHPRWTEIEAHLRAAVSEPGAEDRAFFARLLTAH
jgi:hypothetical protein